MSVRPPWAHAQNAAGIRPAGPEDRAAVSAFIDEMDADGLYQRHFAHGEAPNRALLARLDAADGSSRVVLLARDADARVIGHAEYVAQDCSAEFALMVLPAWRDCGLGKAMLDALIDAATAAGHAHMHGLIQATNTPALMVAKKRGFRPTPGDDPRTVIVSRPLAPQRVADPTEPDFAVPPAPLPNRHDPDRTSLHRRPGP
jgi:acetyltransferase